MRRHAALLIALALLGAGCSHREHANPFDPSNPSTGGSPASFQALAANGRVTLRWDGLTTAGLYGYQIFRRVEGESEFTPLSDVLAATQTRYDDFGLANGIEHRYRLYFLFSTGLSPHPAEDGAIPGPLVPWATDLGTHASLRITADGRHVYSSDNRFSGPTQVAVDASDGVVWTSDTFAGTVTIFDPTNLDRTVVEGLGDPSSVAIDPTSHDAWVCDEGLNLVHHLTPAGNASSPAILPALSVPIGIAVNPNDRSVWVCENLGNSLRHFSKDGAALGAASIVHPSRVAVDSLSGDAWVTSFDQRQVVRVGADAVVRNTYGGFAGPIGIAVDARRGLVWVADAMAGVVVVLRRDGNEAFRLGGLPRVREIAVDLATGSGWVSVPGAAQIVAITSAGIVASRVTGLGQPYGIALDPGAHVPIASLAAGGSLERRVTLGSAAPGARVAAIGRTVALDRARSGR